MITKMQWVWSGLPLINYYKINQWQCINHKYNSPISIEAIPTPSQVGTLLKIIFLIWSKSHKGPSVCGLSTSFHLASPHMTKTVTELSLVNPFNNFLFLFKSNKIYLRQLKSKRQFFLLFPSSGHLFQIQIVPNDHFAVVVSCRLYILPMVKTS